MNILHVTGAMNRGGAEVMLMDIFRTISSEFHFDFLVNYKIQEGIIKADFDDEILDRGSNIKYIGTQWDLGPFKYINEFKKIINEIEKPDVVHIHLNAKSGIIALAARFVGIKKIIVHSHADLKFRGSFLRVWSSNIELHFQKILINLFATDYWGASEEANKSLFYNYLNKKGKTKIINNAVDTVEFQHVTAKQIKEFREDNGIQKNTLVLGNIGRIVRHKNVSFIIDILNEFNKQNISFYFLFAGRIVEQDYMNEINEKIKSYQLSDKVIHLGNRGDIPVIVSSLDLFIAPALKEGFGLVAVEAQAAGVPCLLYTGFPKSVDMHLNLVTFIDSLEINRWVYEISKIKEATVPDNITIKEKIVSLGFDIQENSIKIENLYKNKI